MPQEPKRQKTETTKTDLDRAIEQELEVLQGCLTPATLARVTYYAQHVDPSYWPLVRSQYIVVKRKSDGTLKATQTRRRDCSRARTGSIEPAVAAGRSTRSQSPR